MSKNNQFQKRACFLVTLSDSLPENRELLSSNFNQI